MAEKHQESPDVYPHLKFRKRSKWWPIIGTIVYSLPALYFTYIYIGMSAMIFDAPGSESKGIFWPIIGCYSFLLPVPVPVYLIWRRYCNDRNRSKLPALLVLISYYSAVIVFGVIYWEFLNVGWKHS